MTIPATIVFVSALLAGLFFTALVRRYAPYIGLVDQPDGRRKLHRKAIPVGGGAAVFLAAAVVLIALFAVPSPLRRSFDWQASHLLSLLMASAVIVVLGLVDDRVQLRGRQKLVGQLLAASILIADGLVIHRVALFGWQVEMGLLAVPFTVFWLLGAINSVNLLDGIDGLATMLGVILVATFAALALMFGRLEVALVALAFAGALCGFMRYNFPPASIFLGDAGSMLIGLVVGALAIHGSLKGPGTVLLAAPLAVWILPILDSSAAILRRRLTGRSMYSTDRAHLHHRLMERFGSNRKVLAAVAACCAAGSVAALVSVALKNDSIALFVVTAIVAILIATGMFGKAEFLLVWSHVRALARSLFGRSSADAGEGMAIAVRLQGRCPWENVWSALAQSARDLKLLRMRFDVNAPLVHEEYNARWERPACCDPDRCWTLEIPLLSAGQLVGRLTVVGQCNGCSAWEAMSHLSEMLHPLDGKLQSLLEPVTPPPLILDGYLPGEPMAQEAPVASI